MKKQRNRKQIIKDGWLNYKGEKLEICNSQKYGIYKEIIVGFIGQLDAAISIHKRLLVIRLDFKINHYTKTNLIFSNFMKQITQWINRNYDIEQTGYQWVREQETSKKQHYHLALMLDGDKIQNPKLLNEIIREKWLPRGGIYIPNNCYYYIDKHNIKDTRPKVIYRVSYMAKSRGKSYRSAQTKDSFCSRLKS